jgi:HEAT repeat protein
MKVRPILVVGVLVGLGAVVTCAEAGESAGVAEPKWGKSVDGLRCRFVPPSGAIAAGLAPTILIEVENVSKAPLFWKCPVGWKGASGPDWHNGLDSPDWVKPSGVTGPRLPQGCARPGAGVRTGSVREYQWVSIYDVDRKLSAPMPGFFQLKPGARMSIVCVLPWRIEKAGPHTVTGRFWRREIDMFPNTRRGYKEHVEKSMMPCLPIRLNVLTADAVRGVAEKEVAASRKALKDKDADVRLRAAVALGNLGAAAAAATPDLLDALGDADGQVRWCVAGALAHVAPHDEKLVRGLTGALADKQPGVRARAAEGLATIGPKARSAVPALIRLLKRSCAEKYVGRRTRGIVVHTLISVGETAVPFLIEALSDEDPEVRCGLIRALGIVGVKSKDVMPALIGMASDKEPSVRIYAARAFGHIGLAAAPGVPGLIRMLSDKAIEGNVAREAAEALGRMGPGARDAIPALVQVARGGPYKNGYIASNAARALGLIGDATGKVIPTLIEALGSKDSHLRFCAVEALGRLGPMAKAAVPQLIQAVKDKDTNVRQGAVIALGQIGPAAREGVPALIHMLKEWDIYASYPAIQALGRIGPDAAAAIPALTKALKSESEFTRNAARQALKAIRGTGGPE